MRKFVASLALLAMAGSAFGQSIYSCPDALEYPGFDDGGSEFIWKLNNPSGASDYFSVDFDSLLAGTTVRGVAPAQDESTAALSPTFARTGIYGDNLTLDPLGNTPDLSSPLVEITGSSVFIGLDCKFTPFNVPGAGGLSMGSTNVHVVYQFEPNDSSMWLCGDSSSTPSGRSFNSADAYTTPATSVTRNHMIRVGIVPSAAASGTLLFNGVAAATVEHLQPVSVSFYGPATGLFWALFTAPPLPIAKVGPILPTGFGGPIPSASTLCGTLQCNAPVNFPLSFNAFYLNIAMAIKKSTTATLTATPNNAGCGFCFGQDDDGAMDISAFKASNPSTTLDWFNVKHGSPSPASGVSNLTAVEVCTWDFCGTAGPGNWAEVGIYPADLAADALGRVPNIGSAVATVGGASASVTPSTADWGYPAHTYGMGSNPVGSSTIYHSAVNWVGGDSCLWIAADTTGTGPDPCGTLPNSASFTTSTGYATLGVASSLNWMIKIDWD
jgi:hypothetical protein